MTDIRIRTPIESDHPDWLRLWQGYNQFYKREVAPRTTERLWPELLAGQGPAFGLIAERDGRAVGFAHWFLQPSTSDWGPRLYLQDLFADPDLRGAGIGRALITAIYDLGDRHQAAQVWWLTDEGNATARKLYDRMARKTGFIKYMR